MTRARDLSNLIGSGNYSSTTFTATAGQTAFTISHTQGFVQVFMNGLLLDETVDYTSNGTAITLTSGAAAGDEIEVVAYNTFSVGYALNQAAADTRYVNTTGDTMTGNLLLSSGSVGVGTTSPLRQLSALSTSGNAEVSLVSGTSNQCSILMGDGTTGTDLYRGYLQYDNNTDGMLLATSATARLTIDSNGYMKIPYQPAFYANVASGYVNTSGGTIVFETQVLDVSNSYNNTNGVFTAPITGIYQFDVTVLVRLDLPSMVTNSYGGVRLKRNGGSFGADYYQGNGYTRQHESIAFTVIGSVAANDTVVVDCTLANGARIYSGPYSSFSGRLIS